ncbi:MAG TPA: VOC family protein [Opitutus sp.]|nr:VOC family protein [Opitutus sp.]
MTSLRLDFIHLRVSDLARALDFYGDRLGFDVVHRDTAGATLAVASGAPGLLTLTADPAAPRAPRHAAGLFHAALLLPSRAALGGWLRRAADRDVEFDGFSDHGVSEAIYLSDPDGNGLEFYADRPRERWPFAADGQVGMFTRPLAVPSLLAAAPAGSASPLAGARWGHLHLRVRDLERSGQFYRDTLGLVVTQSGYAGARFLAADGYHHHLGLNTWGGVGAPQPPGALGLASARFSTDAHAPAQLRDPDGIAIEVATA